MVRRLMTLVILLSVGMPGMGSLSNFAFAEGVDTTWVRRYNGPGNNQDWAYDMVVDASGNVYVTGHSFASDTWGSSDYATIKYYPNGDTAWIRRYNGPADDYDGGRAIALDDSGNVYVTGVTTQSTVPLYNYDYLTIKYNPNGDTAWVRRYNGPGNGGDYPLAVAVDDSGNTYVTGQSCGGETGCDYATVKYYANGDTAWVRRYTGFGVQLDTPYAIAADASGNVYVTGYSVGSGGYEDYATIKYYPDGDTAWVRRYNGPGNSSDMAFDVVTDAVGNVYVTGFVAGTGGHADYATIKYYANGDTAWVRTYNGPGNLYDQASAIAVDDSGNVYVTGVTDFEWPSGGTDYDYATIKYYPNGDTAWVRRYNGPGIEYGDGALAVAIDTCGNTYVTGYSWSGTSDDYATLKYDSSGNELWVKTYNGPGNANDAARAIAVCGCDIVYVTGNSKGSGTDSDYATIKYIQTGNYVQDETGSRERPSEFTLSQNYPNPFNPTTKIEFTLAKSSFVSLDIYGLLGRRVKTLISQRLSRGYKSVEWDGKNVEGKEVASGMYFYQLRAGDITETKKMLFLK